MTYRSFAALVAQSGFTKGLSELSRELERDVPNLTRQDKRFLGELRRQEARYRFAAFRRLNAIAARSRNPAHLEAMPELIRAETVAAAEPRSLDELTDLETTANGTFDLDQWRHDRCPSAVTRAALVESGRNQIATTRLIIDRLLGEAG
jgi:hypothetical protein